MRKAARLAIVAAMLVLPRAVHAHVGWGIVVAPDKTIFVADVLATTVWRIRPTGGTSVLWHGAHSHGLALDRQGNVYGENARFAGGKFVVTVWRVNPQGHYDALFNLVTDPPAENIVLNDGLGYRYYWNGNLNQRTASQILRVQASGAKEVISGTTWGHRDGPKSEAKLESIGALAWGPDSSLYATEGEIGAVRRVGRDGSISTVGGYPFAGVAHGSSDKPEASALMGIVVDSAGTVYVADNDHHVVRAIANDGSVRTVLSAGILWSPSGVAVGPDGIYVLEHTASWLDLLKLARFVPYLRVRKVDLAGHVSTIQVISR